MMKEFLGNSYLFGSNAPFIEGALRVVSEGPAVGRAALAQHFEELQRLTTVRAMCRTRKCSSASSIWRRTGAHASTEGAQPQVGEKQFAVFQLITAYRTLGVRLATSIRWGVRETVHPGARPGHYGLTDDDMDTVFRTGTLVWKREGDAAGDPGVPEGHLLRTIGVEYMYMTDMAQKRWVQERLESIRSTPQYDAEFKKHILERLTAAETLEKYMHTRYVGQKRFSGEGGESLIPELDVLMQRAARPACRNS